MKVVSQPSIFRCELLVLGSVTTMEFIALQHHNLMILTIYFIRTGHLPANRKPKNWFAANVRFRKLPSFDLSGNFHSQKFGFDSIEIQVLKGLRVSFVIQSIYSDSSCFFQTIWKNVIFMHHHASKLVKMLKDCGGNGNKQKESAAQKKSISWSRKKHFSY